VLYFSCLVTPCQSSVPSACFAFRLSPKIMNLDSGTIASAHLKLHVTMNSRSRNVKANITSQYNSQLKTKNQHIVAMYYYHDDAPKTTSGQIKNSRTHTGKFFEARQVETNGKQSVVFDVTHVIATQLKHALHRRADQILHGSLHGGKKRNDDAMTLQFQCKTCVTDQTFAFVTEGRHAPYVVIKVGKQRHRQRRQVIECHPLSTTCCRDKLYIDFAAIGWNHWILQPSGYNANFCRGDCQGELCAYSLQKTLYCLHYLLSFPNKLTFLELCNNVCCGYVWKQVSCYRRLDTRLLCHSMTLSSPYPGTGRVVQQQVTRPCLCSTMTSQMAPSWSVALTTYKSSPAPAPLRLSKCD
jgi:hypothetical protein